MDNLIILDDNDYESDSSGTIDNDPDTRYFLDDIDPNPAGHRAPTPALLSSLDPTGAHEVIEQEIIDLTAGPQSCFNEGDYLTDECFQGLMQNWRQPVAPRSPSGEPESRIIPEACVDGILYRPGQSVELHDETYLRIEAILVEDSTRSVFLRGRRLVMMLFHPGMYIPHWRNEMVWMVDEDKADIPLEVVKRFVAIHFTNSCQSQRGQGDASKLFCRVKESKSNPAAIEYLSPEDADQHYQFPPQRLRQEWRGASRPFGEADDALENAAINLDCESRVIDLTGSSRRDSAIRRYTFGDGFCGAGGVSAGAQRAGLHIKWAFDKSPPAITTYRLNHATAICEESDIFSFLTNEEDFLRVDVSHGSPPCQTFSPAHTINCTNDDANSACIFSSADLIKKSKPRIHTMEETCGLFERHKDVFFRVIQDFIELGYSVRWDILNCMDFGVPQSRRRLIIIASGPGEALPAFPRPTHGLPDSGLQGFETINSIISGIPPGAADHDIQGALERGLRNGGRVPFDANQPARTVTCGGGEFNYHPSGRRGFTNREFACLQTFPMPYRFGQREIRKQIGNAVPPILARAIYREILRSLRRTDEEETAPNEIIID